MSVINVETINKTEAILVTQFKAYPVLMLTINKN